MIIRLAMSLCLLLVLSGFEVVKDKPKQDEITGERQAQNALPQSKNPLWTKLGKCRVDYDQRKGIYSIDVTEDVKALNGQTIDANGFILPLDGADKTKHFLLAKRTPVCQFCPPGEPNEVIEVKSKKALDWVDDPVTLKGKFTLINDGEKGVFFLLEDAELIRNKS
jgi:hypothetical protein